LIQVMLDPDRNRSRTKLGFLFSTNEKENEKEIPIFISQWLHHDAPA